jgi:hypothetical protein
MATERPNQFKIMLSDEERAWLEAIASSRGLSASDVLRLYVREAHAELEEKKRATEAEDDFRWKDHHNDILSILVDSKEPVETDDISQDLHDGKCASGGHYDGRYLGGLGRWLNQLRRNGYVRRLTSGYVITPKGKALTK